MDFLYAVILGAVEGLTEFLPISSTGHLILVENWLRLPATEFWKSFTIAIQLGAILAVVMLYWRQLFLNSAVFKRLVIAFLPTAVIGLFFYKMIKQYLLGSIEIVLIALALGGVVIIIFEKYHQEISSLTKDLSTITYRQSFLIGLAQAVAIIPGVSRAAATIMGGLVLGLPRQQIVEFSFLLAIPTMAAATAFDLIKTSLDFSGHEWGLLTMGFIVSFLTAAAAVKWLLVFIANHNFTIFGWYRLLIAVALYGWYYWAG